MNIRVKFCAITLLRLSVMSLMSLLVLNGIAQAGKSIRFVSTHAPFPDSGRVQGHYYNGNFYDAATHYQDSSVLLYIPSGFKRSKPLELVIWFHGWFNNIDSADRFFRLTAQFEASGRNAIFVFLEGPKDAPDSYGGKLERDFAPFVLDVLNQLKQQHRIAGTIRYPQNCSISLAGHSGAYRVISKIIAANPIDELILFDALYGGNDAYLKWISETPSHRFIHIYTRNGGTYENTQFIMRQLKDSLHTVPLMLEESTLDEKQLATARPIFIFSEKQHNDVITYRNNWELFLRSRRPNKTE